MLTWLARAPVCWWWRHPGSWRCVGAERRETDHAISAQCLHWPALSLNRQSSPSITRIHTTIRTSCTTQEYISIQADTLFSSAWVALNRWCVQLTKSWRIPIGLVVEISSTDKSIYDAASWLNIRSPTRSYSLQYAQMMHPGRLSTEPLSKLF